MGVGLGSFLQVDNGAGNELHPHDKNDMNAGENESVECVVARPPKLLSAVLVTIPVHTRNFSQWTSRSFVKNGQIARENDSIETCTEWYTIEAPQYRPPVTSQLRELISEKRTNVRYRNRSQQ